MKLMLPWTRSAGPILNLYHSFLDDFIISSFNLVCVTKMHRGKNYLLKKILVFYPFE